MVNMVKKIDGAKGPVVRAARVNDLWLTEEQTENMRLSLRVTRTLCRKKTPYQDLLIVETPEYGRALVLDGAIQLTERDEFCYSEMMAHVPLAAHPNPRRVLIVGGGDGAILREVLRHSEVESCTLIDIDQEVIQASKEHLPNVGRELENPRADVRCIDALEYIRVTDDRFDVAIVDSTDPVDFAAGLFQAPFYSELKKILNPNGMMTELTESPFADTALMRQAVAEMRKVFPVVRVYWGAVPTYPSGMWTYGAASLGPDPAVPLREVQGSCYYSGELHRAAFALPPFLRELIEP
ncbi:MAG: polyamine aminopropyltransferase [Synergistaceae bacterium]|jgi:spermidine synthase|nr:polyamine aminopropyltransferase [Synergistaceae bacterium]